MKVSDYTFLGTTQSLCPECLALTPTKIIVRNGRVYFRKQCPTHGTREDFVCSDVRQYDQLDYSLPSKLPIEYGVEPDKGCPFDCGLCSEHEQHTCIGLVEITSSCNLTCPMCYASSAPGGKHLSLEDCQRAIDRLVEVEGCPEVLQLSGGEPTIHPRLPEILNYAMSQPIDYVQINTNGIRLAHDAELVDLLASHRDRLEVFFQLDGLSDGISEQLRGESLLETKLAAIEALGKADVHITLAATLQGGVNDNELGPLVVFGLERPWITGINLQPATYSGRFSLPDQLENRITFPDVIRGICEQTDGLFQAEDFMPLPCAHPNCHQLAYVFRSGNEFTPLTRFFDARNNLDLLANGIVFTRERARNVINQYLGRQSCCGGSCGPEEEGASKTETGARLFPVLDETVVENGSFAEDFFEKVVAERLGATDVFRITITSFLDAYNFDVRRLMKCCTHHILPSGHVIPFCAYNVLYREGHVALPQLSAQTDNRSHESMLPSMNR